MIVIRDVFQAKYGKGGELANLFRDFAKEFQAKFREAGFSDFVLMEDLSGPFFTIVTERRAPSMAAWEQSRTKLFSDPRFGPWFERMMPLVENGRREFWNIASESK